MKKVKKLFLFVVFMFMSVLTLASCGETPDASANGGTTPAESTAKPNESTAIPSTSTPTPSTSTPTPSTSTPTQLTDEQVKANFDTYAKSVRLSKASINGVINSVVNSGSTVDPSDILDKISIPNAKATATMYLSNEAVDSQDLYAWQKDKVIYFAYAGDTEKAAAKLDLAKLEALVGSVVSTTPTTDTDYVGMILSQMKLPADFDVDGLLSKITFTGDDFTYKDGWFTLKNEKIVSLVTALSGEETDEVTAMLATVYSKLEIKLGFDGVHFTGFSVEFDSPENPNFDAISHIKTSLVINYEYNFAVGGEFKYDFKTTNKAGTVEISVISLDVKANGLGVSVNARVKTEQEMMKIDATLTAKVDQNGATLKASGTVAMGGKVSDDGENQTIVYDDPVPFNLDVTLNKSKLTASAKVSGFEIVNVDVTLNNFMFVSGKITIDVSMFTAQDGSSKADFDKIVIEGTTKDVTIPADVVALEADAADVIDMIMGAISGGGSTTPNPEPDTDITK